MYTHVPENPIHSTVVKSNRTAFVSAYEEMDEKVFETIEWMIGIITNRIMEGQNKYFKNPGTARRDAESFIAALVMSGELDKVLR